MAVLSESYQKEQLEDGTERRVLKLKPRLAPVKVAILPLVKKDGLPEIAREIFKTLSEKLNVSYNETASIGKRYRKQDEIGTPYCLTIDHQTKDDQTVTIRYRDSMKQERIKISDLNNFFGDKF